MGGYQAAMLQDHDTYSGYFLFLTPFTWQIWTAFFSMWIFYACILFFMSQLNQKADSSAGVTNCEDKFSFFQCIRHFSLGTLHYGVERYPPMVSGKVLQCFWSMLMLILVSIYTANLAAILSENSDENPLCSINEIVRSGRKVYASKDEEYIFREMQNPLIDQMLKTNQVNFEWQIDYGNRTETVDVIMSSLKDGSIWISLDATIEEIAKEVTNLYRLEGYFSQTGFSFAMRKNWKWTNQLKKRFVHFSHSGYFDQLNRQYDHSESGVKNQKKKEEIPFKSLAGVFGITLLGGICTALFQIVYSCVNKRRKRLKSLN